jgi:hypothetical protein
MTFIEDALILTIRNQCKAFWSERLLLIFGNKISFIYNFSKYNFQLGAKKEEKNSRHEKRPKCSYQEDWNRAHAKVANSVNSESNLNPINKVLHP